LAWLEADAERLPLADASVDSYTIAFGLRNVTRPEAALADAARVLRRGGRLLILEFSAVEAEPLRSLYDAYSFNAIPALGRLVVRARARAALGAALAHAPSDGRRRAVSIPGGEHPPIPAPGGASGDDARSGAAGGDVREHAGRHCCAALRVQGTLAGRASASSPHALPQL